MEIKSKGYDIYLKYPVRNIPDQEMTDILNELSMNAIFLMGDKLRDEDLKKNLSAVIYVTKTYYGYIPLYLVAEAFGKGSIGNLGGTSKFNARNINIWLTAIQDKYQTLIAQQKSKEDSEIRIANEKLFKQNQSHNVQFGTALCIKLTWVYEKRINPDDWDHYTLDLIVDKLKQGYTERTLTPKMIWKI
jgi:hypothetical protein